jgi:peptidoglycan/LPS O-acetylase OafA/YrhL
VVISAQSSLYHVAEHHPPNGWCGEIRSLTTLRLFAAVWVLVFHFHFTPGAGLGQLFDAARPVLGNGALGVDLFFVISGFVIAHTYLATLGPALRAGPAARFLWARICRIWPVYAVVTTLFGAVLVAKLAFGTGGHVAFQAVQPEVSVESWLRQLLMMQMWTRPFHDGASWVGPAWSCCSSAPPGCRAASSAPCLSRRWSRRPRSC